MNMTPSVLNRDSTMGISIENLHKMMIPVTSRSDGNWSPDMPPRKTKGELKPNQLTLDTLSDAPVDKLLGKKGGCKETDWLSAHSSLLESMRSKDKEDLIGAVYEKGHCACATGRVKPFLAPGYERLRELVKDSPVTTIVYMGDEKLPQNQKERQDYMAGRVKKAKYEIFYFGGLLENRHSLEAIMTQLLEGLIDPEDIVIYGISHSGAEQSYKDNANLANMHSDTELQTILGAKARIHSLTGKTNDDVIFQVGHSKGGYFNEQSANHEDMPKAGIIEWGPVIVGQDVPVSERAEYLKTDRLDRERPAPVQSGFYGGLLKLSLLYPDKFPRKEVIRMVGQWIAGHFVGKKAHEKIDAVATIMHELVFNRSAIIAQQHSLSHMRSIVESLDSMSSNPRHIEAFGYDDTLNVQFQRRWRDKVYTRRGMTNQAAEFNAAESGESSGHNPNVGVVKSTLAWMREHQMTRGYYRERGQMAPRTSGRLSKEQLATLLYNQR